MQGCKKIIFIIMIASILLLQGCTSFLYAQGAQYFQYQEYIRAFDNFAPLARQGNPDAQYAIGYMYFYGLGVNEDHLQAVYWMTNAAKQGQPLAIEALRLQANAAAKLQHLKPVTIY